MKNKNMTTDPSQAGSRGKNPKNAGAKPKPLDPRTPTRGASVQGERQAAKGGPAGANQGGANRGGSRVEPSHTRDRTKKDRAKK